MQSHCLHLSSGLIDMIGSNADAQRLNDELARLRAEVESLKDESARDYADMRRFQALYIEADHARLALRAEVETLRADAQAVAAALGVDAKAFSLAIAPWMENKKNPPPPIGIAGLANAIEDSERHLAALSATVPPPLPPV